MICLVLAMSGTSALLSWVDKQSRLVANDAIPAAFAQSSVEIQNMVRSVVGEVDGLSLARWDSVDVRSGLDARGGSTYLTAAPGEPAHRVGHSQAHFRIDENGQPFATEAWIRQLALGKDGSAITIQVAPPAQGESMTPTQWQCVRALIAELATVQQGRRDDLQTRDRAPRTTPVQLMAVAGDG